ncbi:hypothetical protein ACFFUP_01920 [Vibrio ostreicida]|uniref:Peptidase M48 domain-containing protein n=1 Tax=Vibrio ostreicida TaxID=526588 RepID=A0ABT8BWE0_9VIBR|nr:hypothetical protein [Vibrio ostreicida]MDN3610445.1 hypothetical protein [Vibrio ostreicida]NPD07551.1 hypothetical protein [Vibrio ostreicida]
MPIDLFNKTAGLPFLDKTFEPSFLLSLLAKKRKLLDERRGHNALTFSSYLIPSQGWRVFRENASSNVDPLLHTNLNNAEKIMINQLEIELIAELPDWRTSLSLPIQILRLEEDLLSSSATSIPQHMFLSARAFANRDVLCECYIHELSHLWLTCYAEIFDFQVKSFRHHTLPTGTTGKDARGVVYAAFFAASVLQYLINTSRQTARASELSRYLSGCLTTLTEHESELSSTGRLLHKRLIDFQQTI